MGYRDIFRVLKHGLFFHMEGWVSQAGSRLALLKNMLETIV